jgi:hypothetical protein
MVINSDEAKRGVLFTTLFLFFSALFIDHHHSQLIDYGSSIDQPNIIISTIIITIIFIIMYLLSFVPWSACIHSILLAGDSQGRNDDWNNGQPIIIIIFFFNNYYNASDG